MTSFTAYSIEPCVLFRSATAPSKPEYSMLGLCALVVRLNSHGISALAREHCETGYRPLTPILENYPKWHETSVNETTTLRILKEVSKGIGSGYSVESCWYGSIGEIQWRRVKHGCNDSACISYRLMPLRTSLHQSAIESLC